jgi:RNA polymerase sporulation-specific sigma factor
MAQKVNICGLCTSTLPKLTAKESDAMLKRLKGGEPELREEFLYKNMRLVLSMVQRYSGSKENADDLFQVGMLGLVKALDNFDVNLGVMFSTYAVPMILGEMRRFLRDSTALKVGRGLRDIAYRTIQAREEMEARSTQEASLFEIAKELNVPYRDVVSALDAIAEPLSLYEQVYSDGEDSLMVLDQISDKKDENTYIDTYVLKDEMKKLPEKERLVLELRYFQGQTQNEISKSLNISQAQISRLEKSGIERMRAAF